MHEVKNRVNLKSFPMLYALWESKIFERIFCDCTYEENIANFFLLNIVF